MALKAVIFDCFGVLVSTDFALIRSDYKQFNSEIFNCQHKADLGELSKADFFTKLSEITGLTLKQIIDKYWNNNKPNMELLNLAKDLKNKYNFKICMLSNVNRGLMDDILPILEDQKIFDELIISSDLHLAKPDPKIFELTAKKLDLKTKECLMVDDIKENIDSAINVGMSGIIFKSNEQFQFEFKKYVG